MRAILIDPSKQTIEEITFEGRSGFDDPSVSDIIGCNFACLGWMRRNADGSSECLYVDDDGIFDANASRFTFCKALIFGRGLILGTDALGAPSDCTMSLAEAEQSIGWLGVGQHPVVVQAASSNKIH